MRAFKYSSEVRFARLHTENAPLLWCEAGPHCRVLNGGLEAVTKRVVKKKVSKTDLLDAYTAYLESTRFDAELVLTRHGHARHEKVRHRHGC